MISEVNDMKSHDFASTWENSNKKLLKLYLEFNFNNLQTQQKKKIIVDCYNILTIGMAIIEFHINIITYSGFTIILFFFLFHSIFKVLWNFLPKFF